MGSNLGEPKLNISNILTTGSESRSRQIT